MLYRKYARRIEEFLKTQPNKILLVNGARQIGKSFIIRYVGKQLFKNYVEINLKEDKEGDGVFAKVRSVQDFHVQLSALAGKHLDKKENTLVFLDEIQSYPALLTMLKFLNQEGRYTYIASGSQLGVALSETPSVPLGSIAVEEMYPLDFEEFLLAMDCGANVIEAAKVSFQKRESLSEALHDYMLRQFKTYLLIGGLPEVINTFIEMRNIARCRKVHRDIHNLYRIDASQYDEDHKLVIRRIYDMIPSVLLQGELSELTKKFEQTIRGTFSELLAYYEENGQPKGEIVIVVEQGEQKQPEIDVAEELRRALETMRVKEAAAFVAEKTGLSKKELYQQALILKDE